MTPVDIIERIRKLLALSDPAMNSNEAEAVAALEKARKLLDEHDLSLSDVEFNECCSNVKILGAAARNRAGYTYMRPPSWLLVLSRVVADYTDTRSILVQHRVAFVGTLADTEAANAFLSYLLEYLDGKGGAYDRALAVYKSNGKKKRKTLSSFRESFFHAAIHVIRQRIKELIKIRKANQPAVYGLVLHKQESIDQLMAQLILDGTRTVKQTRRNSSGVLMGLWAGEGAPLAKELE